MSPSKVLKVLPTRTELYGELLHTTTPTTDLDSLNYKPQCCEKRRANMSTTRRLQLYKIIFIQICNTTWLPSNVSKKYKIQTFTLQSSGSVQSVQSTHTRLVIQTDCQFRSLHHLLAEMHCPQKQG